MGKDNFTPFNPLEELAKRAHQAIIVFDQDLNEFIFINPSFEHLWQKSIESITSNPQDLIKTLHPEDKEYVVEVYQKLIEEPLQEKNIEFRIILHDSETRWISLQIYSINQSPDKYIIAGIAEDITSSKNHEANLKKFAAKKDSVLEILSHDLAAPFNNIKGIASILSKKIEQYNDPEIGKMVEMISKTSERSIRLIREFVKQEFLESSHEELIKKRVDVIQVIKDIVEQYKHSEKDIKKTFTLASSSEKLFIPIDEYKFAQIINNLISNAIKFTHDGGHIAIIAEEQKGTVLFTVDDNGIGIPADRQDGLFEKFTKARRPGIKGEPSVGLGMSIIKTIVEWHNGKIWFESEENKGSKFFIEMPKN